MENSEDFRVMQDEKHVGWFDTVEQACERIEAVRDKYPDYCTLYCDRYVDGELAETLFTCNGSRKAKSEHAEDDSPGMR